jgi:hypothetical protein
MESMHPPRPKQSLKDDEAWMGACHLFPSLVATRLALEVPQNNVFVQEI